MTARSVFLGAVLLTHFAALAVVCRFSWGPSAQATPLPEGAPLAARIIIQRDAKETVPIPEVQLHLQNPDLKTLQRVRFDDNSSDISGVIGSTSSPQLARAQIADPQLYARRAGLTLGRSATVLLVIEVLPDGSVGAVTLLRGTTSVAIDAAAMEYARLLRWTPGTVDHQARAMRITLPVTLANPA